MALLQQWRDWAYSFDDRTKEGQEFWASYFAMEQGIYKQLLSHSEETVSGTVEELAAKYETETILMAGFLDGINDSLVTPNLIDTMEKDTQVTLDIDLEKLYYNMVACRADWLYNLEEWDALLPQERRDALYKEQKMSTTVVNKERKIGRNEPCPCGSGKKYKKCCGANK